MVWAKLASAATAFGQTTVRRDGTVPDRLTQAWTAAADHLPEGWTVVGLHYAGTRFSAESRPDDWVALATGPSGEQRAGRATDAVAALEGLATSFDLE